jgi:hypothetical protein
MSSVKRWARTGAADAQRADSVATSGRQDFIIARARNQVFRSLVDSGPYKSKDEAKSEPLGISSSEEDAHTVDCS